MRVENWFLIGFGSILNKKMPGKHEESSPSKCKKNTLLQEIGFSNSHSPKFLKPEMLPPNCLTHYQSAVSIFPSKKIDSKGICQKSKNPVFQIIYLCLFWSYFGLILASYTHDVDVDKQVGTLRLARAKAVVVFM